MITNVTDPNKFLYHYTSAATAIDCILKNRTLRLSPYTTTNDPKERKDWLFDFGTCDPRKDLMRYNREEFSKRLSREFKHKTHLTCFSRDADSLTGNHLFDIFKRGFCKPRMWDRYADKHRGVCLVFDRERLIEQIDRKIGRRFPVFLGPVTYKDQGIGYDPDRQEYTVNVDVLEEVGMGKYLLLHLQWYHQSLFFEKMTDWKDENEWRCLTFTDSGEPVDIHFEQSLVGLVFGDETTPENRQQIMNLNHCRGVHHIGLRWKNSTPWYDWK